MIWAPLPPMSSGQLVLISILAFLPIVLNLWAIWHSFTREFPTPAEKMAWFGAAVFIPVLGGLAYLLFGRKRGKKPL
ncbi:PLD nuclease N-terminal domain-containing protein [Desulfolutivibrio sp.]|uniref:PLD nuclease N-terminal domain-containing protein n=1 Tax=Desulfolutivibrio sp. TaxID=2773296 RepID=UPI002F96554E